MTTCDWQRGVQKWCQNVTPFFFCMQGPDAPAIHWCIRGTSTRPRKHQAPRQKYKKKGATEPFIIHDFISRSGKNMYFLNGGGALMKARPIHQYGPITDIGVYAFG